MADDQFQLSDGGLTHDEFTRVFTLNQRAIYLYIRSLVANTADVDELSIYKAVTRIRAQLLECIRREVAKEERR